MKQVLVLFAVIISFMACKNKHNNGLAVDKNLILTDTASLHKSNMFTDTGYSIRKNSDGTITTTTITTTTTGIPHGIIDTVNNANVGNQGKSNNTTPATNDTPGITGKTAPLVKRDKGWSSAAKGTAIGAGSGAILGAVVSDDKVKGAVIGGVAGAAGGYVIVRDMDKKSGRVERKKKQ